MDTKQFIETLKVEAQAQFDFNRQEWPDNPGTAEDAVRTALECCSAELSMQDYATAVDAVGAGKKGFVAAIAATIQFDGCWETWTGTHYPTLDSVPWQARGSAVLVPCDGTGAAHS